MPELPEIQTIVNDLQQIIGDHITGFVSYWPKSIKNSSVKKFATNISGRKILGIERIGKNIAIALASGNIILIHLKMTGQLVLDNKNADTKYARHIFYLKRNGALEFRDIRKFGTLEIIDDKKLAAIREDRGVDPFSKYFTLKKFSALLDKQKNKVIKAVLMDQQVVAGIGNIYASEILFEAKILPMRKTNSLKTEEIKKLYQSIKKILRKAVLLRGTSSSDYRDVQGEKGQFQDHLKVYQRAGKKCVKCATIVEKLIIGQRSTFYCPHCQH
jgi:formamidopyrimidine-DNA glycosylase